jgi:hypothetical protein
VLGSRKGDMEGRASGGGRGIGIDCKGDEGNKLNSTDFDRFLVGEFFVLFSSLIIIRSRKCLIPPL